MKFCLFTIAAITNQEEKKMAQLYVEWEHDDVVENNTMTEDCCMKQTVRNCVKKTTGIKLRKLEAMALCIYHFTFNMFVCAMAAHYEVAYYGLKWLMNNYSPEAVLSYSPEAVLSYSPEDVLSYSPDAVLSYSPEFGLQFMAIFINVMLIMQLADEFGKIIFAAFFCKNCPDM